MRRFGKDGAFPTAYLGAISNASLADVRKQVVTVDPIIEPHNAGSAAVWNAGGAAYDELSRWIADAIEHAVSRLAPRAGEKILDVATGTGWTARRIAQHGAETTGIDFGPDLIAAAQRIAAAQQLAIHWRVADAERLPFADGAFDAVISTFGVMFVARPERAAQELARVCRRGGRLALVAWLADSNVFEMFKVMKPYLPVAVAPAPSPFEWGRPERVRELLEDNFDLRFEEGVNQLHLTDGEAAWRLLSTGYGPTASLAASLDLPRREALRRDLIAFHERFRITFGTTLGITMPRTYLVALGVRR
jgi:SAM-dependent methyltransferase